MTETNKVYLNSADADIVVDDEYKFFLGNHISLPSSNHRFSIGLGDMCLPLTFYNVFSKNDTINLVINSNPVAVLLEHGNYDIDDLLVSLNDALVSQGFSFASR